MIFFQCKSNGFGLNVYDLILTVAEDSLELCMLYWRQPQTYYSDFEN